MQMSFNGSGTFVINSTGQPVVTGTIISSSAFNALTADLATGLSTTMTKDGQTTATANIPMGSFKFTGLGVGSAATDSANISQVQNSFGSFLTVSGTNTITATVSPALTAYATGQMFAFVAANTNTGAVTINISSLGAKAITKTGNTALSAGDLTANYLFVIVYDGTQFQVVGVSATTFTNLTISGVLTLSGANTQLLSTGTGAWKMPVGTTGQRPASPASGMIRQNSTTGNPEWYDATTSSWLQFSQPAGYSVNYLVVAGGGGGGTGIVTTNNGGGGGAGGLLTSSISLSSGTAYTITVGAGGATNANGVNSVISSIAVTATGGGAGTSTTGASGGSGGGGSGNTSGGSAGGAGTVGQGNAGGLGMGAGNFTSGGGGGASAVGVAGASGGTGGAGASNSISGTALNYAGGGGGGGTVAGAGGAGGGGAGSSTGAGTAGIANTGGGGGGASNIGSSAGGAGGSGIVIISYLGSQRGTGGTVTSSGGYTIHTFTASGTYNA